MNCMFRQTKSTVTNTLNIENPASGTIERTVFPDPLLVADVVYLRIGLYVVPFSAPKLSMFCEFMLIARDIVKTFDVDVAITVPSPPANDANSILPPSEYFDYLR